MHELDQNRATYLNADTQKETCMLLKDKVAVITGGAGQNGLGFATARMMAEQGARVVILDLAVADPQAAAARLGAQHLGLVADVTDKASCEAAAAQIKAAMGKVKSGEYQFIHDSNGNVWAGNKATGSVTQTHQGDPSQFNKQHTPAEIQTMEYLVKNGVAKNTAHAWDMVRSSREKTRGSFIMDYVSKNQMPGQDIKKLEEQAGSLYDNLRGSSPTAAPAAAPASGGSNWSDWTR